MLYPFLLSSEQKKGVKQGVSLWAIGQLLIAGGILFVWGRMVVHSFKPKTGLPVVALVSQTPDYIKDYALTPTATEWHLSGMGEPTIDLFTPTPEYIPTITPWVVTATPTSTPEITPTMWYEDMYIPPVPGIATRPGGKPDLTLVGKLSYYYPPYAYLETAYEINCDKNPDGSLECEHMASGEKVFYYVGEACACPGEFPFGTVFEVMGGYYTCRDRGGAIQRIDNNKIWLDLLYPYMPGGVQWGYETQIKVWLP